MDYDDFFETLDELLTTINGTVEDEAASDSNGATVPIFSYMFDLETDVFEGLDEDIKAFRLSPLH